MVHDSKQKQNYLTLKSQASPKIGLGYNPNFNLKKLFYNILY